MEKLKDKGILKRERIRGRKPLNFNILIWALAYAEGEEDFSSVVLKEAAKLSEEEMKAYCYICALDRFGLSMSAPLIRRLLGEDATGYLESLVEKKIIRYIDKYDLYISRHEVVAESIFRYYSSQICELQPLKVYKNILQKATLKEETSIVHLFHTYLEKDLSTELKDDLMKKYKETFSKSSSPLLLGLGWGPILYNLSCNDLAEKAYRRSLNILENFPDTHIQYANFLYEMEKYKQAELHFKRALELKEYYPEAHYSYARFLFKRKRYPEAEAHFKRASELKENSPVAHNNVAILLEAQGSYKEAEAHYQRALELTDFYPEAHNNYGAFLVKLKRYEEAKMHLKRALELKEDFPKAHYNYAVLLYCLKRYQEAELHYKRALELVEDFPEAMAGLGFLYKDFLHSPQKALYWLKKAWEHRDKLPDKGESIKKALEALSAEKEKKKEEKPPSNEL